VARICNLERKFVLSPSAVRYWFPPIGLLGELVENFCCAADNFGAANEPAPLNRDRAFIRSSSAFSQFAPTALTNSPKTLSRALREDANQLGRIAGLIFEIFREQTTTSTSLRQPWSFGRLFKSAEETIAASITPSLDTVREFVPTVMDEIANLIDARVEAKLAARLQQEPVAPVEEKPSEAPPPQPEPEVKKNGNGGKRDATKKGRKRPETD